MTSRYSWASFAYRPWDRAQQFAEPRLGLPEEVFAVLPLAALGHVVHRRPEHRVVLGLRIGGERDGLLGTRAHACDNRPAAGRARPARSRLPDCAFPAGWFVPRRSRSSAARFGSLGSSFAARSRMNASSSSRRRLSGFAARSPSQSLRGFSRFAEMVERISPGRTWP